MTKDRHVAVLIVGAGPTGLTLACDLARRLSFRIIDKAPEYFAGSRGKGLQPRSLEVLDDLGVVDQILANGRFHLPFRGYDGATVLGDHILCSARTQRQATRAFRTASSILRDMAVERMTRKTACWSWSDQTSMSASSRMTTH